jgi:two-component system sensor histidine kinase ChiS
MLGTLGEKERMDGSVISDAVNLASRLEGLTRMYGASVLITSQTVRLLRDRRGFRLRLIDRVRVKGRRETVMLFEVLDGDVPEKREKKLSYRTEFPGPETLLCPTPPRPGDRVCLRRQSESRRHL